ncbi:MAG: hypothetical protein L6247_00875 [Desulfobacteraceae bacterium]|nr:hypothetical protein [Pseudomonadota bacterium]MBU4463253.1 hypothetical protein [Pseudomonadota bacterium]MCG2754120.1 hypothetical protein [Desulfobacteraceae bacterium]
MMENNWNSYQAWVAYFDILGFKSIIEHEDQSFELELLKRKLDEVIIKLEKKIEAKSKHVKYQQYADTFIIYSKTQDVVDYGPFLRVCKDFISNCIYKRLPIRGAISYGELIFGHDKKVLIGKAFLESYVYGEDQNWIGLILTPSASTQLLSNNLNPLRHGFINQDIPMRKFSIFDDKIYAYIFINGSTSCKCPALPMLKEMYSKAPKKEKAKYKNTIKFIEKYYKKHQLTSRRSV